jgi:hypothetical protein
VSPGTFAVSPAETLLKPAVFLRNLRRMQNSQLDALLKRFTAQIERVQMSTYDGPDMVPDMAVVYFKSAEAALDCVQTLHGYAVSGGKLSAAYREVAEPAVRLQNLPAGSTAEQVTAMCGDIPVVRCVVDAAGTGALVVLNSPQDAVLAATAMHRKKLGGSVVSAIKADVLDTGVSVTFPASAEISSDKIVNALSSMGKSAQPKSISFLTNNRADIGFLTVDEVILTFFYQPFSFF